MLRSCVAIILLAAFLVPFSSQTEEKSPSQDLYTNETVRSCKVPPDPPHGKWVDEQTKIKLKPGLHVKPNFRMNKVCNKKFKHFSSVIASCGDGDRGLVWLNLNYIGDCRAVCPSLSSNEMMKVTCTSKNNRVENCTDPMDNTIAEISCKPKFQNMHIWESKSKSRVCSNGKWDNRLKPNCIPKSPCGIKAPDSLQPLVVNGTAIKNEEYPWHVAIYRMKNGTESVFCGGSLINEKLVVTAAHCITNPDNGQLLDSSTYKLAVGKQYSKYNDRRDKDAQFSAVKEVFIPSSYMGYKRNMVGDIAILVANESFKFDNNTKVLPICLNFGVEELEEQLLGDKSNIGYVSGFGTTETGNMSETLKHIGLPINPVNCSIYLPDDFTDHYSYDKFCAGYFNESKSVCTGDSGGGLVIQNKKDGRYYLTGVVSLAPPDTNTNNMFACNSQQYSLYTKVAKYKDFISEKSYEYVKFKQASALNESVSVTECRKYFEANFTTGDSFLTTNDMAMGHLLPFLAYIEINEPGLGKRFCRGSLISDQFVLTAAHCSPTRTSNISAAIRVKFMHKGFEIDIDKNKFLKEVGVAEIFIHPDYQRPQIYNDIALFKLDEKIKFTEELRPACLNIENHVDVDIRTFTWSNHIATGPHFYTQHLQTQEKSSCQKLFLRLSSDFAPEGYIDDLQFCVHTSLYLRGKLERFCEPPGGYPLIVTGRGQRGKVFFRVAGVASDAGGCPSVEHLVPFTRVSTYVPWIEEIVWG